MSKKATVYLSSETMILLDRTTVYENGVIDRNTSGRICSIVTRYSEAVYRHCPEFEFAEWCAICNTNISNMLDDYPECTALLWVNVANSSGIDAHNLVVKMRRLSYIESIAVAEIVQRVWTDASKKNNQEWLQECGAKFKPVPL